jgi:hypothetical protein
MSAAMSAQTHTPNSAKKRWTAVVANQFFLVQNPNKSVFGAACGKKRDMAIFNRPPHEHGGGRFHHHRHQCILP